MEDTIYNDLIVRMGKIIDDYELGRLSAEIPTKENKTITISVSSDDAYSKGAVI